MSEFPNIAEDLKVWWFHADGRVHASCSVHPAWDSGQCGSPAVVMQSYAQHLIRFHATETKE